MTKIRALSAVLLSALVALSACARAIPATAVVATPTAVEVMPASVASPIATTASAVGPTPSAVAAGGGATPGVPPTRATAIASPARTSSPGGARATPAPPPVAREGVIRFSAFQASAAEARVAVLRPDGSGQQSVVPLPGHPWGPRLSPDGTRLLFSSAAPAVASRPADLDLNGSGSPDIWLANLDGSQARRLTDVPAGYNGWAWSPDGRRVAFASNRSGSWDLYTIDATGANLARLTVSAAQDGWPAWTPDGSGIVFASTTSDRAQLYRIDGRGVQRLLNSPTSDTEPAVAPNGAIAFSAQTMSSTGEIFVLDPGQATPRQLASIGGLNSSPSWSPDGARLAFVGSREGRSDLYVVGADGRGLARLTVAGQNQRPDWGRAPAAPLTISLAAQNASGQGGTATLTDLGDGTTLVAVALANPPAVAQPLHIHEGTCAALAARVAYPLSDLIGGISSTVIAIPLAALLASPHAINAHRSPQEPAIFVACGNIAPPPR